MKSLKTKIIVVLFACVLMTSLAVGGIGIITAGKVVDEDTTQIMRLYCKDKAQQFNNPLQQIQHSVQQVSDYAKSELDDLSRFKQDTKYVNEYTDKLKDIMLNAAEHTPGAMAFYIRYNPTFTEPTSGLFYTKKNAHTTFAKRIPTDFSQYDPSDVEHVGWYYIPVKNEKPTWMTPYLNENINVEMISYCIPIIIDQTVVGVVGMDIDFKLLTNIVDDVQLYDSGYAFLVNQEANMVYHRDYRMGTPLTEIDKGLQALTTSITQHSQSEGLVEYPFFGENRTAIYQTLENGMIFVLAADTKEINATRIDLVVQIVIATMVAAFLTFLVTYLVSAKMTEPILELNSAAKRIADGDLDFEITHHSQDEIGILADSFRKTVGMLQEHIGYIKGLAYRDPLTGVKSRNAYLEAVQKLESEMQTGQPEFAVIMFDINGLKTINDKFGHDMGDMQIIAASKNICKVFIHSPVYRIGGDEFIVVLTGTDLEHYDALLEQFKRALAEHNTHVQNEMNLVVACGIARYNTKTDLTYQDVFKRADLEMYHNKEELKSSEKR